MLRSFTLLVAFCAIAANAFLAHLDRPYERSQLVQVRAISERDENGDRRLHVRAFDEDHHVTLTSANDIFSPNFRAYTAQTTANGEVSFKSTAAAEKDFQSSGNKEGHFYSVSGSHTPGSVFIKDSSDGVKVEGLLNDRLLIVPQTDDAQENNLNDHMVYQLSDINDVYDNDTLTLPTDPSPVPITTRQSESVPSTVTVEVLVLFDYFNTKALNFDLDKIKQYLGIFWNVVQNRYAAATNPNIKIAISGVIKFDSENDQPFFTKHKIGNSYIDVSFFEDLSSWLRTGSHGVFKNDVVMLHTRLIAVVVSNGHFGIHIAGKAFRSGACSDNDGDKCAFTGDKAPFFTGVRTAAHELGHLLGLDHDGNVTGCLDSDQYIMSTDCKGFKKQYDFSPCSLANLRSFVSRSDKKCLWNSPLNEVSLSTNSPASWFGNQDDFCKKHFNDDSYFFTPAVNQNSCRVIVCATKSTDGKVRWSSAGVGAPEGMPCEAGKMCFEGKCIPNGVASLDEQCKRFGPEYSAWDKKDPNICNRLLCTNNNNNLTTNGGAAEGSTCGNYGSCLRQQCINQVLSLDDQCKRQCGDVFIARNKDQPNQVCKMHGLWCFQGYYLPGMNITPEPNSACALGKICRDEKCVNE